MEERGDWGERAMSLLPEGELLGQGPQKRAQWRGPALRPLHTLELPGCPGGWAGWALPTD